MRDRRGIRLLLPLAAAAASACMSGGDSAPPLGPTPPGGGPTVVFDVFAEPLPEIPLPNDIATRVDFTSPTGMRLNASMIGPTKLERDLRRNLDRLDGWGTFAPIFVRFDAALDVPDVARRHQDNQIFSDDAVYLLDIDPASPEFGKAAFLDMGRGNFPIGIDPAKRSQYFQIDPRREANNLLYDVVAEDANGNGVLDPGEDTDQDGTLDRPNILNPDTGRLCAAAEMGTPQCAPYDHLVQFYEYETNTLTIRPVVPLRERGRYAVVLSKRLRGVGGEPVRSPFPGVNHVRQSETLSVLPRILAEHPEYGIGMEDVAFAWTFSTQSVTEELRLVVDGIRGEGPFAWVPEEIPPVLSEIADFEVPELGGGNPRIVKISEIQDLLGLAGFLLFIGFELTDFADIPAQVQALLESYESIDYLVAGAFETPYFIANEDAVFRTDPATGAAEVGTDRATWWMAVPKTIPGDCEPPFPVAIYQHGYSSSKLEMLGFAGSLGRFCIATIGLDAVEHGPDTNFSDIPGTLRRVFDGQPLEIGLKQLILDLLGPDPDPFLLQIIDALLGSVFEYLKVFTANLVAKFDPRFDTVEEVLAQAEDLEDVVLLAADTPIFRKAFADGRAVDVTGDGAVDSGARFWTGNLFRTRDQVRQTVVDLAFLVRVFQGWDGVAKWPFDLNRNGLEDDVAGDFDADGRVDAGGPGAKFYIMGQSMGGFFTALLPAVEPAIRASSPSVSGAGLADVGVRTTQEGAVEAIFLEIMGPLVVGGTGEAIDRNPLAPFFLDPETRYIGFDVAAGNQESFRKLVEDANVEEGDVATLSNAANGRVQTATLGPGGTFRLAVDAQKGDPLTLEVRGPGGVLKEALTVDAPASGFGERRNTPDFRRLLGIAQTVLEPADPGNYAPYLFETPFPGRAPSPMLIVNTIGDQKVPLNVGITLARRMGLVDYLEPRPEYGGRTENDALIAARVMEGLAALDRFTVKGKGGADVPAPILFDPAYFGDGKDKFDPERIEPGLSALVSGPVPPPTWGHPGHPGVPFRPVRCIEPLDAPLEGCAKVSALALPYIVPEGRHGFFTPSPFKPFDVDTYMINKVGRFFITDGREVAHDACMATNSCACLFRTSCGPFAP